MKRTKRIAAGIASLAMIASMAVAVPLGASAATAYTTNTDGTAVITGDGNDAWLTQTVTDKDSATQTSYNAVEFKKVLEIEDTANIPSVSFDYAVTSSGSNIAATYYPTDTDAAGYDATKAGQIKTLAVFAGVTPDNIEYKYENIANNATAFTTDSSTSYEATPTAEAGKSFKVTYAPQNVVLPAEGATKKADHDDNVLLYNAATTEGNSGVNTYYAIKTVQMDFSKVKFTEPGIYRYYIQESGANQGVTNDYSVTDNAKNCWRTLDVYVEDATFVTHDDTENKDVTNYKLKIAGYVMYVGKQTDAPQAGEYTATTQETDSEKLEDGLNDTAKQGLVYGTANGAEVANATKSEGIRNLYETSDITFKKLVTGNQASKDKFFKFNIKLTNGSVSNVADTDVFIISTTSTQVVDSSYENGNTAPNSATPYTKGAIYTANYAAVDGTTSNRYVTGTQLKAGYDFYLQDGQQVTIQGIPNGVGYVLKEYQDDYTPTVALKSDTGYDNLAGDATGSAIMAPVIANVSNTVGELTAPENTATITDDTILGNVEATFTNTRKGTIPTGILLSVAAPAGVGIVVIGGIVYLLIKNKRREAEEE